MIERDEAALQALQKMYHDEDYAMDLVKQAADRLGDFQPYTECSRMWNLNKDDRMKGGIPREMSVLKVMVSGYCNSRARLNLATKSSKKDDARDADKDSKKKAEKGYCIPKKLRPMVLHNEHSSVWGPMPLYPGAPKRARYMCVP